MRIKSATLATTVYRGLAALMLSWAIVHTGESWAEDTPPPPRTGSLVSGLFSTPPASSEKDLPTGLFGGPMVNADLFLSRPDEFAPAIAAPASLASRIVAAEGGPGANSASSAAGYGQFLRGTWLDMFARTYPQLAQRLNSDQILALREVKPLALELTGRYAQENAFSLRRARLSATEASLSLAHAVGPAGAINILISRQDQPVENVLSADAIAANPFMKEMTAGMLQRWAINRVRVPAEVPQPKRAAPRLEDELELLQPSEDFRIDGQTKASQALAENRKALAALQNLLDAASKIGAGSGMQLHLSTAAWLDSIGIDPTQLLLADPNAVRAFNKAAGRFVLDTIRSFAIRTTYREFKSIESKAGARGELPPAIIRDVVSTLLEKMRRENTTIVTIVRHRRSISAGRPVAEGHARRGRS